jgi:hypothetical protein
MIMGWRHSAVDNLIDIQADEGCKLNVSTLADWTGAPAATLMPLVDTIIKHEFAAVRIHANDAGYLTPCDRRFAFGRDRCLVSAANCISMAGMSTMAGSKGPSYHSVISPCRSWAGSAMASRKLA